MHKKKGEGCGYIRGRGRGVGTLEEGGGVWVHKRKGEGCGYIRGRGRGVGTHHVIYGHVYTNTYVERNMDR